MFDASDPRSGLPQAGPQAPVDGPFDAADYVRFHALPPQEDLPDGRTWYARGRNVVIAYTTADAGLVLDRVTQRDEYAVLLPDPDTALDIEAAGSTTPVRGGQVVFVPPGPSRIVVRRSGRIVRMFTSHAEDLLARCPNAGLYADPARHVPPLVAWPAPPGGWRVRAYDLDVPPEPGRFGRIWRCSTIMVNMIDPIDGPRDPTRLSPHHHDDLEQCSLALSGEFIHHLRWPWTVNRRHWRPDQHETCGSPSVALIPPPAIHTTEASGPGRNQLVDIFCPPRRDFSERPGWVLNASDYPAP